MENYITREQLEKMREEMAKRVRVLSVATMPDATIARSGDTTAVSLWIAWDRASALETRAQARQQAISGASTSAT